MEGHHNIALSLYISRIKNLTVCNDLTGLGKYINAKVRRHFRRIIQFVLMKLAACDLPVQRSFGGQFSSSRSHISLHFCSMQTVCAEHQSKR